MKVRPRESVREREKAKMKGGREKSLTNKVEKMRELERWEREKDRERKVMNYKIQVEEERRCNWCK